MVQGSRKVKSLKKPQDTGLSKTIPKLVCLKKPDVKCNNGFYEVVIPLEYIIEACKVPAAYFSFKFVGLRGEWK